MSDEPEVMYLVRSIQVPTSHHVYGLFRDEGRARFWAAECNRVNKWAGAVVQPMVVTESISPTWRSG